MLWDGSAEGCEPDQFADRNRGGRRSICPLRHGTAGAVERLNACGCGEETSRYGCLRKYRNSRYHDQLTKGGARTIFREISVEGGRSPRWIAALEVVTAEARPLLSRLAEAGAPVPEIGEEVGDGWPIEVLWRSAKVAVVGTDDPESTEWLLDHGYTATSLEQADVEQLILALIACRLQVEKPLGLWAAGTNSEFRLKSMVVGLKSVRVRVAVLLALDWLAHLAFVVH